MTAPRLLPLIGVAVGGVLAVKLLAGAQALPDYLQGARAWAEGTTGAAVSAMKSGKALAGADASAKSGAATLASAAPPPRPPAPICAPTAAELAREAGLSPAELQTLQSLGTRRGQLDDREKGLETQLALINAAAVKLDGKIAALNGLKSDIQGLMGQATAQKTAEVDRLVIVYSAMKPKDAAARMTLLDDDVRLPIAMKMKERTLAAILAQMPPLDAKALTEKLAARMDPKLAAARAALAAQQVQQAQAQPAAGQPAAAPAARTRTAAAARPPAPAATKPPVKTADAGSTDPIAPAAAAAKPAAPHPVRKVAKAKVKVRPHSRPGSPSAADLAAYATPRPYASLQPAIGLQPPKSAAGAPAAKMAAAQPTPARPAPQPQTSAPKPAATAPAAPKPATITPAAAPAAAKSS